MSNKIGKQTIKFDSKPSIISSYSVVGPKEDEGPLSDFFDLKIDNDLFDEKSWELAESKMLKEAISSAIENINLTANDIDFLLSGDLLNQLMSSSFAARDLKIPFLGLYGACSTMTESMCIGSMMLDGNYANKIAVSASSHFSSAERQFRFPLELGNQRAMTSQWTVTGAGSFILSNDNKYNHLPRITHATIGKVIDLGVKDASNMGAAMAPSAADTIAMHLSDTNRDISYYDLVVSGDLGHVGHRLCKEILHDRGIKEINNYTDCGILIFDRETQDTHAGGSGCGCSGVVFSGYIYKKLLKKELKKVLLMSTGALLSVTSSQQGQSIPGIAHAVSIEID